MKAVRTVTVMLLASACLIGPGCFLSRHAKESPPAISQKELEIIAIQEARRRGFAEVVVTRVIRLNRDWIVTVWRAPMSPGLWMDVRIDQKGKVLDVIYGE